MTTSTPTTGLLANNIFQTLEGRDTIYIQQMGTGRECVEMITGCEISNRFEIKAAYDSPPFFKLVEDSNCIVRQCCKGIYPFEMNLVLPDDQNQTPQIVYQRDFHCTNVNCLCPCGWMCNPCAYDCCCGTQELAIYDSQGRVLGCVKEEPKAWCGVTGYGYYDNEGVAKWLCTVTCCEICRICCCQDVVFQCTRYGTPEVVGTLTRKCVCTCVNIVTDKDHFELQYIPDANLTAMDKFSLMSMVLLVKYMHFEQQD